MSSHHTEEQIQAAFARAPRILKILSDNGVHLPRFELFQDASGLLILDEGKIIDGEMKTLITNEQVRIAQDLVRSNRPAQMLCPICVGHREAPELLPTHTHLIGVTFCCGLIPEELIV